MPASTRQRGWMIAAAGVGCSLVLLISRAGYKGHATPAADLILKNGRIVTLDPARPTAAAVAICADRIVHVGNDAEIETFRGERTDVIDLGGRLTIPGFIESHAHFTGIGEAGLSLRLGGAKSWEDIVAAAAAAAKHARPGEWIRGQGWRQDEWLHPAGPGVDGFPVHDALSRVTPDNPVVLQHASRHASMVNARAMQIAGITSRTPHPAGGEILKDATGRPVGMLLERAADLVDGLSVGSERRTGPAAIRRFAELADEECLAKGITSFQDAGSSFEDLDVFRKLADENALGVRLWVMVRESNERLADRIASYRTIGAANHHLTVRAIKVTLDGALGSRGAWLLAPYSDRPSSTGLDTVPIASLSETARLALQHDMQLCVHAIGDRANRETLDVFERAIGPGSRGRALRWRIEHAQHLNPADIPRFGQLGVIASMQGIHATSDAPFVVERLGEQRASEGAYVWRTLLDTGAMVVNGTDAPVEDVNPIANFYASVTRRLPDGSVFYGDQRMTRMEALRSSTLDAAYAAFEEETKGSIQPGKLADLTVLTRDILAVPDDEIPGTEVVYTIVGGKVRYRGAYAAKGR